VLFKSIIGNPVKFRDGPAAVTPAFFIWKRNFYNDRIYLKKKLGFMARHKVERKQSIQVVCEHFEPLCNAARGT